nr:GIY-YIG nuclease family protein [uncultured Niameybacter sp.]
MYFVYIVKCQDKTYYTGYTNNIEKRLKAHNDGKGAKYTRVRLPVQLVYKECYETKSEALKREYAIKKLTRSQKEKLIQSGLEEVEK